MKAFLLNFTDSLVSCINAFAPWVIGAELALILFKVFRRPEQNPIASTFLVMGVGGYLGNVLNACVIIALNHTALMAPNIPSSPLINVAITILCLSLLAQRTVWIYRGSRRGGLGEKSVLVGVLFLFVTSVMLCGAYVLFTTPAMGWDALNFWLPRAAYEASQVSAFQLDAAYFDNHRHPKTLSSMIAARLRPGVMTEASIPILWLSLLLSCVLVTAAYAWLVSKSAISVVISTTILLTVPLFESHWLLIGYSELLVCCALLCAAASYSAGLEFKQPVLTVIGLGVVATVFVLRNTGPILSLSLFFVMSFAHLANTVRPRLLLGACVFTFFIVLLYFSGGNSVFLGGNKYGYVSEHQLIRFAGQSLRLELVGITDVSKVLIATYMENSSFSIILVLLVGLTLSHSKGSKGEAAIIFMITAVSLPLQLSLLTTYGAGISPLVTDTGYSRFSLHFVVLVPLLISHAVRRVQNSASLPSKKALPLFRKASLD